MNNTANKVMQMNDTNNPIMNNICRLACRLSVDSSSEDFVIVVLLPKSRKAPSIHNYPNLFTEIQFNWLPDVMDGFGFVVSSIILLICDDLELNLKTIFGAN